MLDVYYLQNLSVVLSQWDERLCACRRHRTNRFVNGALVHGQQIYACTLSCVTSYGFFTT